MDSRIRIGQITSAVGIKGEVRVFPYTDIPERFKKLGEVELDGTSVKIESSRVAKNMVVLKLAGTDDRNAAERLRGKDLFVQREKLSGIPEDTFFIQDLEGLCVVDEEGRPVGTLSAVYQRSVQDLYEITREDGKTFLLPAVKEFVRKIDLEAGTITVRLIEGISDL
ncbi:MAG: 16S rRNA processing protein RimM [Firmicutes bacterium]|nr:16S rRNA processing protein RimM [Bacillota bacterium]